MSSSIHRRCPSIEELRFLGYDSTEKLPLETKYFRYERRTGQFKGSFVFPTTVVACGMKVTIGNGTMKIAVPKFQEINSVLSTLSALQL